MQHPLSHFLGYQPVKLFATDFQSLYFFAPYAWVDMVFCTRSIVAFPLCSIWFCLFWSSVSYSQTPYKLQPFLSSSSIPSLFFYICFYNGFREENHRGRKSEMHNYLKLKQRKEKRSKKKEEKGIREGKWRIRLEKIPGREKSEMERIIFMCVLYCLGKTKKHIWKCIFMYYTQIRICMFSM